MRRGERSTRLRGGGEGSPAFHLLTVVWGARYTKLYTDVVLPTHASAGNGGALKPRRDAGVPDRYVIYTTREDGAAIKACPAFATLSAQVEVRFEWLDPWFDDGVPKHEMLSKAHKHGIERAAEARAALVFLCPDAVWSDGTFGKLVHWASAGKRAVMMPGIRVQIETFRAAFDARFAADGAGVITCPPRDLVNVGLRHLHQISQTLRWDAPRLNPHCSHLYFPVKRGGPSTARKLAKSDASVPDAPLPDDQLAGLAMRCWHLHPLMVWPVSWDTGFGSTVDGDFVIRSCPDFRALHVVADSDETVVLEMSDLSMAIEPVHGPGPARVAAARSWEALFADPYHRRYARQAVRVHDGSPGDWPGAEGKAAAVFAAMDALSWGRRVRRVARRAVRPVTAGWERGRALRGPVGGAVRGVEGMGRVIGHAAQRSGVPAAPAWAASRVTRLTRACYVRFHRQRDRVHGWAARQRFGQPFRLAAAGLFHGLDDLGVRVSQSAVREWRLGRYRVEVLRSRYRANRTQWIAHARRRWWLLKIRVMTLRQRVREVGVLRFFGVRTRLWNLAHGRAPRLLPPRPVRGETPVSGNVPSV